MVQSTCWSWYCNIHPWPPLAAPPASGPDQNIPRFHLPDLVPHVGDRHRLYREFGSPLARQDLRGERRAIVTLQGEHNAEAASHELPFDRIV